MRDVAVARPIPGKWCAVSVALAAGPVAAGQSLWMVERAAAVGIEHTYSLPISYYSRPMFAGGAVGDFNRDGWLDLFLAGGGGDAGARDKLYINNGDGTFSEQAESWGVAERHLSVCAAVGDYNHDGWPDIYVLSLGTATGGPGAHRLYRNNGNGTFTDVAGSAGVQFASPTHGDGLGAAFGDYDLDGDLDLAVAGWFENSKGNRLFRNNGDGTFSDVTAAAIRFDMDPVRGFTPRFVDMNRDRYPELLWVGDFGTTVYLVNNRDGTFTEYTDAAGVGLESFGMGQTVGDLDRDGRLDWYVTSIYYDNPPPGARQGNQLYRNLGSHSYLELGTWAGVVDGGWGWGTVAVDLDHDGWLDLVETNGWNTIEWKHEQSYVWRNLGGLQFEEIAAAIGLGEDMDGRGLLHFDFDNDGDQDLVFCCWREPLRFYVNELAGPGANWLRVFLDTDGRPDLAPDGIGSRVTIRAGGSTQVRHIDSGSNYQGQSEMSAHFGLGATAVVDELRVRWASGEVTTFRNVPANQTLVIAAPRLTDGGPYAPTPAVPRP